MEDENEDEAIGGTFAMLIMLIGFMVSGAIGYQIGYSNRDAEKAKTGYVLRSVNPITGKEYEQWIIP